MQILAVQEMLQEEYSTDINSTTESPGTVYDNVGNSTVCPGNQPSVLIKQNRAYPLALPVKMEVIIRPLLT